MQLGTLKRALGALCLGSTLTLAPRARASEEAGRSSRPDPTGSVLSAGGAISALGSHLAIDGRRTQPEGGLALDVEAGYLHGLGWSPFAFGALLRLGSFDDEWADNVNESRTRMDFRFVSEVSWVFAHRAERPCITFSVGVGPTVAWIVPPEHQLVVERYDPAVGLHGAARLGMRMRASRRHGFYYAFESSLHSVSTEKSTHVRGGSPHVIEHYRFRDRTLGLVAGYALSL